MASPDTISDQKPRPNHRAYLEVLRRMTPEQRLQKAFELSEMTKSLFRQGLRERFPDLSEGEFHALFLGGMELLRNSDIRVRMTEIDSLSVRDETSR